MEKSSKREQIAAANQAAFQKITSGQPVWVGVRQAGEVIPHFTKNTVLHAGPPIPFESMVAAMQGGIVGACIFEGLGSGREEIVQKIKAGEIRLVPGLDMSAPCGAMAATSFSMPVAVVEDQANHTVGYAALQEGPSTEALRWGVYNQKVAERWLWLRDELAPALNAALKLCGGINLRTVISRSLQMGDENHSREQAANLMISMQLAPYLVQSVPDKAAKILQFLYGAERFALHILMAGAMSVLKSIKEDENCSIVWAMGGNGIDLGIKVAALGDKWFTAPAPHANAKYLNPAWTDEDAEAFTGDSCVMEAYGLGGFAAAASPMVTMLTGESVQSAIQRTRDMGTITAGTNPFYTIPALNLEGTPTGIDMIKVLETGVEPKSHAGIALKKGGQAGAGVASIPMEAFKKAFRTFMANANQ